ncbi:MAG: hypothetical protein NC395_08685 [Prevotella sp.]|nr:hypothetical protein [Prevotella sp.]
MSDNARQDVRLAVLYELRLIFTNGEKTDYTKDEVLQLIDKFAREQ